MVPGEGPQPALGMIVGEAAHFEDEEAGRPFAGAAGRLLDTALVAVGLPRSEVFVTNVVKVVPVDEQERVRVPTDEEIAEYSELLQHEIINTAPLAILALGRTASYALTGYQDLPAGSKVENVFTAFHPRAVLRSRTKYNLWLEQLFPWSEAVKNRAAS